MLERERGRERRSDRFSSFSKEFDETENHCRRLALTDRIRRRSDMDRLPTQESISIRYLISP